MFGAGGGGDAKFREYMAILQNRRQEQMGHGQGPVGQTAGQTDVGASKLGEMGGQGEEEEKRFGPFAERVNPYKGFF